MTDRRARVFPSLLGAFAFAAAAGADDAADRLPRLASDGAGTVLAVWQSDAGPGPTFGPGPDPDVMAARSTDGGVTWSPPVAVNASAASDGPPHDVDVAPDVATDGAGLWVAVWQTNNDLGGIGFDPDIVAARSLDGGTTWSAPVPVNAAASDSAFLHDRSPHVAHAGGGTFVAAWTAVDAGAAHDPDDLVIARSTDGGLTWTVVTTLPDVGEEVHVALACNPTGTVLLGWDSADDLGGTIGTDLDPVFVRSADGGLTWNSPASLKTTAAADALGDRGLDLAYDPAGAWLAAWSTSEEVQLSRSSDDGVSWSPPVVLNSDWPGPLALDDFPGVAADGTGALVVAWVRNLLPGAPGNGAPETDLWVVRSADDGATWTVPAALDPNADTDLGFREFPLRLVHDGLGAWVAAWESDDHLRGTIGIDDDILGSRSADGVTWSAPALVDADGASAPLVDVAVAGTKLIVVDRIVASGRAKVVFVARDPGIDKGGGTTIPGLGATVEIAYANGDAFGAFVTPFGWTVNTPTLAKMVNNMAPGGTGQAKVVVAKPGTLFKLVGKELGDKALRITTAGAPDAGGVDVMATIMNGGGSFRHCTRFPGAGCIHRLIAKDTGAKLVCRNGVAVACP